MPEPATARRNVVAVVLEVLAIASAAVQFVGGIVLPVVALVHWSSPPGTPGDLLRLTGGANRISVLLTEQGMHQVYGTTGGNPPVPAGVADGSATATLGGVMLTPTGTSAQVTFQSHSVAEFAATVGVSIIGSLAIVIASLLFWRVARTMRRSDPFEPRNAIRLRAMGWTLVAGWLAALIVYLVATNAAVADLIDAGTVVLDRDYSLGVLILGLVIVALSAVFRQGAYLRADLEGVV